jgi:transcriptional regulator with XRE-family HTH domain
VDDDRYDPVPHDHEAFLRECMGRPGFREAYEALEEEYALLSELLDARLRAGLTQEAVADRMGTTKSAVCRLEGAGKHTPSLPTLRRYAVAVGHRVEIHLVPDDSRSEWSAEDRAGYAETCHLLRSPKNRHRLAEWIARLSPEESPCAPEHQHRGSE